MDSNDFIFSDDAAESLGVRMADADNEAVSGETGEALVTFVKARLDAVGGSSAAILGVTES